ncbi:MAG TPA: 2-succinyl-5-enolpyruvyl-6-hydroxy-3-cyclohexene-1-carboxylic-acid synthase [Solirubrobacteraceae bacterium]|nr:2-succinyl-5-enolpyruvyl-6-hydroxy-3-cyclohexene-1-carboxylic-acid synthase [Solirubrobacteraceae bacterium]
MSGPDRTYGLLAAFVDELARCGVRHACTSPGSRSAPLVISLARDERIACHSHIDERGASFFALGVAKATGVPAVVACTSGTAAAEMHPAVVEAHEARVPLLVLTADRPAELRENGAGQAIDQLKLYGDAAKWFFEVELGGEDGPGLRWVRTLACRAFAATLSGSPGAVHLNFPLREPLVTDVVPDRAAGGRPDGRPLVTVHLRRDAPPEEGRAAVLARARRPLLVAGRDERGALGAAAAGFAAHAAWPLLADPLSGARRPPAAVAHYDALLRDAGFRETARPDLVLRVGDLPVSKPLRQWLAAMPDVPQVQVGAEDAWQDPDAALCSYWQDDAAATLSQLAEVDGWDCDPGWLALWRSADEAAGGAIARAVGGELSEVAVAAVLGEQLPADATLFVASSMPVRDIEATWRPREAPPRVLCNRGASGIDGTLASAFGVAAADEGPVVALIGDVAFTHDIGALVCARRLGLALTVVLLNNGGGGIFDFLPVAHSALAGDGLYERHVATAPELDFAAVTAAFGLDHALAHDAADAARLVLESISSGASRVVEVRSGRAANVALHERMWADVAGALSR